jgi:hypothetical protein
MKRGAVITIIIIALLFILAIYGYSKIFNRDLAGCINAGKTSFNEATGESYGKCCAGLKEIGEIWYDENKTCEEIFMMVGYGSICSDCGNNICESWENKCNCPSDCE